MQDLKVALIQADLVWENATANLRAFEEKMARIDAGTHLVVLPEMFTTGFSMAPQHLAERMDGPAVSWMKARSQETGAHVTGSLIIEEAGHYYNRLIWVTPSGSLFAYDKRHLFRYAGEQKVYTPGNRRLIVTCHGWRIRPFICYDLRFPIWTRNLGPAYDAALFVANWPERRVAHWKALLSARAIENQCYVAGVNRVGVDGNGYRYSGDSRIIDPLGRVAAAVSEKEAVVSDVFSVAVLSTYRKQFPAWMDADTDSIEEDQRE